VYTVQLTNATAAPSGGEKSEINTRACIASNLPHLKSSHANSLHQTTLVEQNSVTWSINMSRAAISRKEGIF